MRLVWENWHPIVTEVPDPLGLDDDDVEAAKGAGEGHKRRRSYSSREES
jgi:hypothetical protein